MFTIVLKIGAPRLADNISTFRKTDRNGENLWKIEKNLNESRKMRESDKTGQNKL